MTRALPLPDAAAAKEREACVQNTDFSIKGRVPT